MTLAADLPHAGSRCRTGQALAAKAPDPNRRAWEIVQQATGQMPKEEPAPAKNPAAVTLGRLGGLKGGAARKAKLSPERRKEIAKKASETRWGSTGD